MQLYIQELLSMCMQHFQALAEAVHSICCVPALQLIEAAIVIVQFAGRSLVHFLADSAVLQRGHVLLVFWTSPLPAYTRCYIDNNCKS